MPHSTLYASQPNQRNTAARDDIDTQVLPLLERLQGLAENDPRHRELRNRVVGQALPLADRLARRFANRGEPLEDLTQVARLGLVNAADHYRTERGCGFTRYAVPSILGEIKRHFRDRGWMVRVPRRLQETRLALNEATGRLAQQLGRSPTVADYAEYLEVSEDQVRAAMQCADAYDAVSLQSPAHRDSPEELAEALGASDPELASAEVRQLLRPAIRELEPRERTILALRYLHDLHQSEIGRRVGLSQMHVSRLLQRTLRRLRSHIDA